MSGGGKTAAAAALLVLLAGLDLLAGGGSISVPDRMILLQLRLPRLVTALLAGAALSLSGAQLQAVFRNPLADPHIMGISAGAGLGAAASVVSLAAVPALFYGMTLTAAAFAGAVIVSTLVMLISRKVESAPVLLISGVMIGFVLSAASSVLQYSAGEEGLRVFYSWLAGRFEGNGAVAIGVIGTSLLLGLTLSIINHKGLDVILFGDDYAALTGTSVRRVRLLSLASACIATGAVTAFCGPIGFVGIVGPHIARAITGTSVHKVVLPASLLTGGIIAVTADILSRVFPVPLPAGSTMAFIGIPFILYILLRND